MASAKEIRADSGKRMKGLREALGMEAFELAERCGVSAEDILAFEAGDKAPPQEVFQKIVGWLCPKNEYLIDTLMFKDF
jgi:transcriptional regulator with XRE-family HTH domain